MTVRAAHNKSSRTLGGCADWSLRLDPRAPVFAVDSAFNGLGVYDLRQMRRAGADECRYTARVGTQPAKCEEACGDIGEKNRCNDAPSCKWSGSKCSAKGWFGGGDDIASTMTSDEASVVARQEKRRILATERSSGTKNVRARRRLNAFVQRRQRDE